MSEKINKISLSSNDDKRLQSTDSVETYGYRTSKSLSRIKEKNKCKNNKNNTKMINFDHITKESIKERNPNWPKTSDHPYIILRIRSSELYSCLRQSFMFQKESFKNNVKTNHDKR